MVKLLKTHVIHVVFRVDIMFISPGFADHFKWDVLRGNKITLSFSTNLQTPEMHHNVLHYMFLMILNL